MSIFRSPTYLQPSRRLRRERQSCNSPSSRRRQHSRSIRRVRFSGSLCVDRSLQSRTLNRLLSFRRPTEQKEL